MVFIPIAIASIILVSLVRANNKNKKVSPERTTRQQRTDELITVILPTINKGS
jgi:hypothetical protein